MAIVKSELIKELKKSFPNFLTQDLNKVTEIILKEIKDTLRRNEGVELRNFGIFRSNIQKASIRRNPKTGQKVSVPQKRTPMKRKWCLERWAKNEMLFQRPCNARRCRTTCARQDAQDGKKKKL